MPGKKHGPSIKKVGDVKEGFRSAEIVIEGHYTTQVQTHSALETHGVVADWKPDMLTVWASTQGTAQLGEAWGGTEKRNRADPGEESQFPHVYLPWSEIAQCVRCFSS